MFRPSLRGSASAGQLSPRRQPGGRGLPPPTTRKGSMPLTARLLASCPRHAERRTPHCQERDLGPFSHAMKIGDVFSGCVNAGLSRGKISGRGEDLNPWDRLSNSVGKCPDGSPLTWGRQIMRQSPYPRTCEWVSRAACRRFVRPRVRLARSRLDALGWRAISGGSVRCIKLETGLSTGTWARAM
jgi:hypothetical protein